MGKSKDDVIEEQRRLYNELNRSKAVPMVTAPESLKESRETRNSREIKDRREGRGADLIRADVHQTPSLSTSKAPSQERNVNPLYEFNRARSGKLFVIK